MKEHIPVLPQETIKYLAPSKNENFIDATCGFGGHSKLILAKNGPHGRLLAIDQDEKALSEIRKNLKNFANRADFAKSNFNKLGLLVRSWGVSHIDGVLMDLGVSTYQLTSPERGFSFLPRRQAGNANAPLDMRMDQSQRLSAKDIVNRWGEQDLRKILREFGEEPFARKIAYQIVKARKNKPIETTDELVEIIKKATPPNYRNSRQKHYATSTFRALRMAVNNELENLENALKQAVSILSFNGRLVVISFHSLEDRIVKNFFATKTELEILTSKPVTTTAEEITQNPKSRSAKLRAARKING